MIPDGQHTAIVDNIEDGIARLEVTIAAADKDSTETRDQLLLDPEKLPEAARNPNAVLTITVSDGDITDIEYDPEETEQRRDSARSRFDRLSQRPPSDEESTTADNETKDEQ